MSILLYLKKILGRTLRCSPKKLGILESEIYFIEEKTEKQEISCDQKDQVETEWHWVENDFVTHALFEC